MKPRVGIVGAGPVGLTLSLLLRKFRVPFTLIERNPTLTSHPSAHYINLRSMEIFSELYDIDKQIYGASEDIEHFRHFKYLRRLFEKNNLYGLTDHFAPSVEDKKLEIQKYSYKFPAHLAQHRLVNILNQNLTTHLGSEAQLMTNTEFLSSETTNEGINRVLLRDKNTNQTFQQDFSLLVACDGFRSTVRKMTGIQVTGNTRLQSFLNIFFKSPKLGKMLLKSNENAMLHFIYNSQIVAVLVNHSYNEGEFVLQVPISTKYQDARSFTDEKCIQIINSCIDPQYHLRKADLVIENIGFWNLSGAIANQYYKDNIVLCGDAAHSFPPAGGFGMNTGVQDAHNLAYKIAYLYKNNLTSNEKTNVLAQYSEERHSHAEFNLSTAMRYYHNSVDIAGYLGLKKQNLELFEGLLDNVTKVLPSGIGSFLFEAGKTFGSYHLEIAKPKNSEQVIGVHPDYKIPLIFLKEETEWRYEYKNQQSDNIAGLLCPHVEITDNSGNTFSLRHLPEVIHQKLASNKNEENPENFVIALMFKKLNESSGYLEKVKQYLAENESTQGKIIPILIGGENSVNVYSCQNIETLLSKLQANKDNIILIRSDSIILSKLTP